MLWTSRARWVGLGLAVVATMAAVAVGFVLRLADPLSSPVIPAEDPYTHMALVREHLRTGTLDPLYKGGGLYPPGLHAFLATVWSFSGIDLYDIVLLGPVFLGAMGVLGMALLLSRNQGPLAGFVGALALAVAPEAIFRTNMMSPTALDLALLPFFLLAMLELLKGRMGWLGVAAPMSLLFVYSHPWLFPIFTLTGLALAALALAFPWQSRFAPLSLPGAAGALACVGVGLGLTLSTCGGMCGPGLRDIMDLPRGGFFDALPYLTMLVAAAPLALLALRPRLRAKAAAWHPSSRRPLWLRFLASAAIAGALCAVTLPALEAGLPEYVDLPRMFGWPILVLAFAALVALPFAASPAACMGAGLFAATYPFVIHNPLESPFWPHRTAVFLGLGLAILAGVMAGTAAHAVARAWDAFLSQRARKRLAGDAAAAPRPHPGSHALLLLAVLAVPAFAGGAVYAGTPDGYSGGWYRMYPACEMDALREVAAHIDANPEAVVMTGDWQAKLVLAALSSDASRVWYKQTFFTLQKSREDTQAQLFQKGGELIVVVDRYLRVETPNADTSFLESPPYRPLGTWCANGGTGQSRLQAYTTAGGGP
ncbi:MAG TPA: hypothetical protein VHI93_01980 [Candidatus Thermoplasmatota archaeon]|nr:hypothetical protein [Candidatus Thermoplasmatota archaeon]